MHMEIKQTPLEGVHMHDIRESFLSSPDWFETQNSVDIVRSFFGVANPDPSPTDITSRIVAAVPTSATSEFRSILINKFRTGDLWAFTTDFGCSIIFQKIPHKDSVNSLRLVLKYGDVQRPLVEYTAGGCTFFDPGETVTNESEDTHEPQKDDRESGAREVHTPPAPTAIPSQENLAPTPSGQEVEAAADESGVPGGESDISPRTSEPELSVDDDDNWAGFTEESEPSAPEVAETEPEYFRPDWGIFVDGDANVRESNQILTTVNKLLEENLVSEPHELEELLTQTPLNTKRYLEFTVTRTPGEHAITIMTKEVPSKLVDQLIANPSIIDTIWERAEVTCGGGLKEGETLDAHVVHVGRVIANALKTKFIRATIDHETYVITYEVPRFKAEIAIPRYTDLKSEAATESSKVPESTLKEEVAKIDAQAIAKGETTLKEVDKLNEAMSEQEDTAEVEATPIPEQIKLEPLNLKITFPGMDMKQLDAIAETIHKLFEPLPVKDRIDLDQQNRIIQNVLSSVLGEQATTIEYTHEYIQCDKTLLIEQLFFTPAEEPSQPVDPKDVTIKLDVDTDDSPMVALARQHLHDVAGQVAAAEVAAETLHEEGNHEEAAAIEQRTEEVKQIFEDHGVKPIEEVVNNETKETDKMIIVRINCKEIVDQPDIDKMRAVIEKYYSTEADDEALSTHVSDAVDFECHVQTVKQGVEYVVTVPVEEDEEPEQSAPETAPTETHEVDEDAMAAEMMADKNSDQPVTVDPNWIDIEDPAVRQQCVQILFPDVIEPSFMHLMHFLKEHHRHVGTPSFLATKETIPTETTIVYDNLTFAIVKMKDGRFWRMFIAHTDFSLTDHDWISTNNIKGRWFQLGRDIHDNNYQRSFPRNGFRY